MAIKKNYIFTFQVIDLFTETVFVHTNDGEVGICIDGWSWKTMIEEIREIGLTIGVYADIKLIPEGSTGYTQPLDVTVNGALKKLLRGIEDKILMRKLVFSIQTRDNIIKLLSYTYHQLCSPRFESLVLQGWVQPGFIDTRGEEYEIPHHFALPVMAGVCEFDSCSDGSYFFVRCCWCRKLLCFDHSIRTLHLCKNFVP